MLMLMNPRPFQWLLSFLVFVTLSAHARADNHVITNISAVAVYFSPNGGCTEAITNAIAKAHKTVLVQADSFTSIRIARALVDAHKRGIAVRVIMDESNLSDPHSLIDFISNAKIELRVDAQYAIAHNKVMILDGATVITGSFNFSKAAEESNAENLLVIQDPRLADLYTRNWQEHFAKSDVYPEK